ncbi:MAG: fused MFS/spermidine synthase [Planctomycetia bacterium]|nr:fused MFS/spermidine synthase [Planctomycetia bacterium]
MHSLVAEPNPPEPATIAEPSRWFARAVATMTFLGAFLLFQVQPLIGNVILPWFGGTPTVWTTSMLFFQAMLVVGYGFVYLTTRFLPPSWRSVLFIACAALSLAALPILPDARWKPTPDTDPTAGVLLLLFACVGGPYFLLSTTGPATQEWFSRAFAGRSPYRLYALSNLGSLLGLLTYPLLVQPTLDLPVQSRLWSIGFGVFALLAGFCAWRVRGFADVPLIATPQIDEPVKRLAGNKKSRVEAVAEPAAAKSPLRESLQWLALSMGGSVLLLGTTNHLCQDVSSFPMLWIAPLVVYLTTFIICFDRPRWYVRSWLAVLTMILVPLACLPILEDARYDFMRPRFLPVAVLNLAMLFVGCMLCHGELAARKPRPQRLTFYYLVIAVGGALGGLFVSIIAPLIYTLYWEWILASPGLFLFAAILLADNWTKAGYLHRLWAKGLFVAAIVAGLLLVARNHIERSETYVLASARNFYGVVQVSGVYDEKNSDELKWAVMRSGSTRHGSQLFKSPAIGDKVRRMATTYYGSDSGIGRALFRARELPKPHRIGVVGLGAGTLATYSRSNDIFHFYEINPIVVDFAKEYFTYLKDCEGKSDVLLGDARLTLENEPPQDYDFLILDAFSSDAIPVHLLTTQAFEIYLRHLNEDGILAIHISNKYLNLAPVVAAAAKRFGLEGTLIYSRDDPDTLQQASRWVLMTRRTTSPLWQRWSREGANSLDAFDTIEPWTDERSNLLEILK